MSKSQFRYDEKKGQQKTPHLIESDTDGVDSDPNWMFKKYESDGS